MRPVLIAQAQQDLGSLARHMNELMHKVVQAGFTPSSKPGAWSPSVDICEMADRYEVIVELAGVRREDIEVYTEPHHLTLTGWRRDPMPCDKVRLHQIEIEQGQFHRCLQLPDDADAEAVTATYRNGLLHIVIAKRT